MATQIPGCGSTSVVYKLVMGLRCPLPVASFPGMSLGSARLRAVGLLHPTCGLCISAIALPAVGCVLMCVQAWTWPRGGHPVQEGWACPAAVHICPGSAQTGTGPWQLVVNKSRGVGDPC